ncbi:amidoligase family protein [Sulfoacidibacillus thermotolerans]|uniref:SWIM-type domain-containing protein n=1 Tax=Sulfoacidibacillus thermotolerans TaxID=1765684 RepID=A0A2U3D3K6_SULT2|nr:amidoligase family protein [Sulfoacidibacillus thermotolerans]PWI55847.1 hypothetical protein BM613_13260 [Sulfoacidibacillus thermotolerans]
MPVNCRVCHRPLRALLSIALGVGPVCVKRAREQMATLMTQMRNPNANAELSFQERYGMAEEELRLLSERAASTAYFERIRHGRSTRPSTEPIVVTEDSRTRRVRNEPTAVNWLTNDTALVRSEGSERGYAVTENSCTCEHYAHRVSRHPERYPNGCRHMDAYRQALGIAQANSQASETPETRELSNQTVQSAPEIRIPVQRVAAPGFAAMRQADDHLRKEILETWKANRAWDGVRMTEDDAAFHRLLEEAEQEWEYVTDGSVLGGTGNTFGVELEMEFDERGDWDRVARDLFNEGLSQYSSRQGYHARSQAGLWTPTRDGSLEDGGLEIVSPIMQDRPEDWEQLRRVLEIAKFHGAKVNAHTGCHTNIGTGPMDSRGFTWQRFARAAVAHEATLYRIGGADSEAYRQGLGAGIHRGTRYVQPMDALLRFSGSASMNTIARRISNAGHFSMINATNSGRIEFRTPNGTLDERQVQAQVMVANAMLHQAAVITNQHPLASSTPTFSEREKHFRRADLMQTRREESAAIEEQSFRRFLDFLGNPVDRKAAAWLWKRGNI